MRFLNLIIETSFYFLNFILAILIVSIIKLFKIKWKSDIWIVGGSGGKYYSDNSAEMHKYILKYYPSIEVFWMIERKSLDAIKAKKMGPILYKHSLKGNVYTLLADVLICNHSVRGDIMRASEKHFKHAFTVDLFHGVTAFKAKSEYPKNNLVIATSDFEKEIKEKWPNNSEDNVVTTGFPRYDTLYKHKNESKELKNIFYMPTWRPWLKKKWIKPSYKDLSEFRNSDFYNEINSFLSNKDLNDFLQSNDYILNVYVHINLHPFLEQFSLNNHNTNIKILSKDTNVQEQLLKSSLLITDYSSVAWDFLYINRPVIFYQFDYKTYQKYNDSYILMPEELFGPVTYNYMETTKKIQEVIEGVPVHNEIKTLNIKDKLIKYNDARNCERVMETILKMKSN